jgi:hypothetical protein
VNRPDIWSHRKHEHAIGALAPASTRSSTMFATQYIRTPLAPSSAYNGHLVPSALQETPAQPYLANEPDDGKTLRVRINARWAAPRCKKLHESQRTRSRRIVLEFDLNLETQRPKLAGEVVDGNSVGGPVPAIGDTRLAIRSHPDCRRTALSAAA